MIRWSAHLSTLFREHPPLERPAAARAAGFALIETWWPPADDLDAWVDAVRAARVGVSCINADGGDIDAGERGFCNLPERDGDTFAALRAALDLAARVDCPRVNVLAGRLVPSRATAGQLGHAAEVLRECGRRAAEVGRTVVVEPINGRDVPGYLVPTAAAVSDLLSVIGHPSVRMLFDAYHCARAGVDPVRAVAAFADVTEHVQYADCPGRGAPGTGTVTIADLVEALDGCGYAGAVGLEFIPAGPTSAALAFLARPPAAAPFPS